MEIIKGGVTAPKGFKAASCAAGIKYQGRTDMAMLVSDVPCKAAATFTSNKVKAACVMWDKYIVDAGRDLQAVVINSGIANACTGEEGYKACRVTAEAVEKNLSIASDSVAVASTGVIGMQLPLDKLSAGVDAMSGTLDSSIEAGTAASKAIMTTDTVNKELAVTFSVGGKKATLGGMSKGSGMIHPNMCTMLAFLTTDVDIDRELMQEALREVVNDTFNMITVDGDTSTNDTLILMASGLAGNDCIRDKDEDYESFVSALRFLCRELAMKMAGDGEGATKLFEARIEGARTKEDARKMARAIVGSNLSKAAIYGCDANFGRFLCAMGYSGADFNQNDVVMYFESAAGRIDVFDKGCPLAFDEDKAVEVLKQKKVTVVAMMNEGTESAEAWGCDLTYDYVKINADYRS
ncbi:bifunctional ornithine acetyltransferase/N-acetylglutamate synthase [Butyrivibrio sp. MC2013]|uniref:bifunctional ornithine acetyltransferase/N-acetylglutamate synthase n=1 Tax=Butyrivibrio sp. MC2013 TaxID=1280686 RepID=UPI00056148AE